jgi:hypothetical protein
MESMPAAAIAVTVGVDTHLDQHVAAVIDQSGRLCGTRALLPRPLAMSPWCALSSRSAKLCTAALRPRLAAPR